MLKKCYVSCSECDKKGNSTNHNCLKCKGNYIISQIIGSYYNCYRKCNGFFYFDENNVYQCILNKECPQNYNKLVPQRGQCINDCRKIVGYQYEFRKECLSECPAKISSVSNATSFLCKVKCTNEKPFEKVEEQDCTDFCGINDMGNKLCVSNYIDNKINSNLILKNIHKDIITSNFNTDNLYNNNQNIIIDAVDTTFTITTNKIQKSSSHRLINLGQCEERLISTYNIRDSDDLIIFIINVKKHNKIKIQFEVYGKANSERLLTKLDLNICDDIIKNNEIFKCSNYSIESLLDDLCISCYDLYHPKFDENPNENSFIKCYK